MNKTSFFALPLLLASATLGACAARAPVQSLGEFYLHHATKAESSDDTFTLKGARLTDLRSGTERDALFETVAAAAATCPSLADSLFYIDCSAEPCDIFLAAAPFGDNAVWDELTCHDPRLAGFEATTLTRGGDQVELAWLVASPPGTDLNAAIDRFTAAWPDYDLYLEMKRQLGSGTQSP